MDRPLLLLFLLGLPLVACAESTQEKVEALLAARDHAGARELLEHVLIAEPQNAEAHFWLGVTAGRLGDTHEAIRQFEQATTLEPTNASYMLELGGAYGNAAQRAGLFAKLGWARKCQTALETAVALDPRSVAARSGLISFYRAAPSFAGGSTARAYEQAEALRKLDPIAGATVLGQLYIDDRKVTEAFTLYEDALRQSPENYGLLYGFGRAAAQTGQQLERGEQCLRRCLELAPRSHDPGHGPVHWRLGNIAEKRGDKAAARAAYESALKLEPGFEPAKKSLAKLNG